MEQDRSKTILEWPRILSGRLEAHHVAPISDLIGLLAITSLWSNEHHSFPSTGRNHGRFYYVKGLDMRLSPTASISAGSHTAALVAADGTS